MTTASASAADSEPRATDELSRADRALQVLCVVTAIVVSVPSLMLMSRIWSRSEFYGHGYLIPLCSLGLIYMSRETVLQQLRTARPPALGLVWVFGASALQALFVLGDVVFAAGLSVPLLLATTVYAIGGRALLRELRLPLGLLVFMVPPPGFVTNRLLFSLKVFVTDVSVELMQLFGVTVAAQGNQIMVPGHTLFVADACSGLTSIVTLTPLAVVVACFLCSGVVRRLLLVASVVPLAVGANMIRVIGTVLLVSRFGTEAAQGMLHESFGMATYLLGTLALVGLARILK